MFADKFKVKPFGVLLGVTMVTCTHSVHVVEVFYFTVEQWSDSFMAAIGPFWVNGYTIICQPV